MSLFISLMLLGVPEEPYPSLEWYVDLQSQSNDVFLQAHADYKKGSREWTSLRIQNYFSTYENQLILLSKEQFSLFVPQVWLVEMDISPQYKIENLPQGFQHQGQHLQAWQKEAPANASRKQLERVP